MGYECTFTFCNKNENGFDYNIKDQYKKVLGKTEDISLSSVAKYIMNQLARRDILVTDVKITEFVKKEISFKEIKNGIVIKNHKFEFGSLENEPNIQESKEENPKQIEQSKSVVITKQNTEHHNDNMYRQEIFDPSDRNIVVNLAKKNIIMTTGKRYAIIDEKFIDYQVKDENGNVNETGAISYVIKDDTGNITTLISNYFKPIPVRLSYQNHIDQHEEESSQLLPPLRRRR